MGMQILSDRDFISLIACSAILVFSISLSGQMHRNTEKALFGFFGLAWVVVASLAFLLYGAIVGFFHVIGSYFLGLLVTPLTYVIAGFIRGDFTRQQGRPRLRNRRESQTPEKPSE
jgi:hypothetical protein